MALADRSDKLRGTVAQGILGTVLERFGASLRRTDGQLGCLLDQLEHIESRASPPGSGGG